jgi:hypothetical protein
MTFVLAKPKEEDNNKIAELRLDRIKVFFDYGRGISLEHSSASLPKEFSNPS